MRGLKHFTNTKEHPEVCGLLKCSIRWAVNCLLQSFTFVWVIHIGQMHNGQFAQTPFFPPPLLCIFRGAYKKNFCRCIISDFRRIPLSVQFIQKKFRKICSFCQPQIRVEVPCPRLPCHMRCIVRKNRVTGILKQAGFFHDSDFPALPVRVIIKTGKLRDKMLFVMTINISRASRARWRLRDDGDSIIS